MGPILERRLRDADPLANGADIDDDRDQRWLIDAARGISSKELRPRRRRTLLAGAVAASTVLAVAGAGGLLLRGSTDEPVTSSGTTLTVTELALAPDTPTMTSCIPFSVELLADFPIAFGGEVTQRKGDDVLITVDTWYRGPQTDQVRLVASDMSMTSLGDAVVDFREGSRYLVTATNGVVNYCGFTGPWTQDLANDFAAGFGTP